MASNIASLGGYDCDFVEPPPDELLCLICVFVAREPMQMDCCGKVYCTACLKEHKKRSDKCPQCRVEGNGFTDRRSERNVKALKVKCDNLKNGCNWTGELASLNEHLDTCDHALLSCPNECKDEAKTVQMLRKDLATHLKEKCPNRSYKCPHCQEEGKHCDITMSHLETCPQLVIACPNEGCGEELLRCDVPDHQKACPFEVVPCKYSKIGCEDKPLRNELINHEEDDKFHLSLAMESILQQEDRLTRIETASTKTTSKMSNFGQYKKSEKAFYSAPFYSHQGGYKMCIRVDANGDGDGKGTHISVFVYLMRGENDDNLTWPFTGTVTVELLSQLDDKQHHQYMIAFQEGKDDQYNRRAVDGERVPNGWGRPQFISHEALNHDPATNCQYLKDDCLYFRVSVKATPNPKPWLTCSQPT